ncbi:MAG: cysteine desulfurase [Proteobacteria bacterium]|nr:cysteine desulfurase [Pseudomonadota bacterium]
MTSIYLDNAATTRVAIEVAAVVEECMRADYGNPSSAHHMGIAAEKWIKQASDRVLAAIGDPGGQAGHLLWTSGGSESDALGVLGAARALKKRGKHIVYSAIEHPAVRESAHLLERDGWRVGAFSVSSAGVTEVERVLDAVAEDTAVVALMLVNNEIGTIQPVAEIARAVKERRPCIHIHCDAVQALGKIDIDVRALGADSVAFAGHKLHAPKGVGALWLRRDARIVPLWTGGGQQDGLRSGTYNVPGIAAMGEAVRLACEGDGLAERRARWMEFAELLVSAAHQSGVSVAINGGDGHRAPHIVSLAFAGIPAEPLLHVLESRGVLVSAGSACSERSRKPSPVLTAIGASRDDGTIRFSFGRDTTRQDIERAAEILIDAVKDF